MKKFVSFAIGACMIATMASTAFAGEVKAADFELPTIQATNYDRFITEIPADADIDTIVNLENRNFKNIQSLKPLFDEATYKIYNKAITKMKKNPSEETILAALEARNALVQDYTLEERTLFIWDGQTMPCVDGEEFTEEDIDTSQMFGYGFEPFAITYLLEDQSQVKGNIIAVSGGGMLVWSNGSEGYPAAGVFNDLGYNYFLLQRRVGPYSTEDIYMDFNRYVKVVKNYVLENDLGGQDMYATLGWSGGGATILGGSVNEMHGYINPTLYDSDYVPDAIDEISGDVDVELVIYGAREISVTEGENPYLPAFYICVGSEDGNGPVNSTNLYNQAIERGVPAQLYIVEGAPHGFGVGLPPANGAVPGTELWPYQADEFMQANLGFQKNRYYPEDAAAEEAPVGEAEESADAAPAADDAYGDIPADYTQVKVFDGTYGFGDAEITAATNADQSAFYIMFVCFDEDQILEGTIEDGIVNVDYDLTGFVAGDAQLIWDDAVASSEEWVQR